MIKRRFYRLEHDEGDDAADSSSSSESELEGEATEEESEADVDAVDEELKQNDEACSTSSGYESEDSSADEINVDSSGFLDENDDEIENYKQIVMDSPLSSKQFSDVEKSNARAEKSLVPSDVPDCVLQIKSVFRCRICPRIVCLTEETMRAHLNSKRHARSEKLLKENRLKAILNNDGQIENQETAAEMHARIVALVQDKNENKNKIKRHQRKRNLKGKEKVVQNSVTKKSREDTPKPAKKKHKSEK